MSLTPEREQEIRARAKPGRAHSLDRAMFLDLLAALDEVRAATGWVIVGHQLPDDVDEQDLAQMGEDDLGKLDDQVQISRLFPTRAEAEAAAAVYWPDGIILEWAAE